MAPLSRTRAIRSSAGRFQPSLRRNQRRAAGQRSPRHSAIVSPAGNSSIATSLQCSNLEMPRSRPGLDEHAEEDELEAELYQTIMAIDIRERGTVGCCYYVAHEEKLYLHEHIAYA